MKLRLRLSALHCAVILGTTALPLPALSASGAMDDLLKVLRDKGSITESEYRILKNSAEADQERASAEKEEMKKDLSEATRDTVKVKTGKSGLKLESADGDFHFQLGGRIMADAAYYDEDRTRMGNGAELRRARIFARGAVYHDWFYKLQLDFAGNKTTLKDAYLGYRGAGNLKLTLGNQKEPFSLNELTSSKYITFLERALPNTFAPGRNLGLSVGTHGDNWGAKAGYYFEGVHNGSSPKSQGWGTTGRVYYAPLAEKTRVLHLGAAASYRGSDGDNEIRFRERPESHVSGTRLVDTGTIGGYRNQKLYGLEAAAVYDSLSLQGEYIRSSIDVSGGGSDPDFSGWYLFGSYFLTGEHRPYHVGSGTFGRVKPASIVGKGGHGAWELAARYSSVDLEDGGYQGGEENNITVGVNWYATPNIRFMANYVRASTDPTSPVKYASAGDEDLNILQVRGQIDF